MNAEGSAEMEVNDVLQAQDLLKELEMQIVLLTGGCGKAKEPILTFPLSTSLDSVSDEVFRKILIYLTRISRSTRTDEEAPGFLVVIDGRQDRWANLKDLLTRIVANFPAELQKVYVLRPTGLVQATFANFGFLFGLGEITKNVEIVLISTQDELHSFLDSRQLTVDLGGSLRYNHATWLRRRLVFEEAQDGVRKMRAKLKEFMQDMNRVTSAPSTDLQTLQAQLLSLRVSWDEKKKEMQVEEERCTTFLTDIPENIPSPSMIEDMRHISRLLGKLVDQRTAAERNYKASRRMLEQEEQFLRQQLDQAQVVAEMQMLQEKVVHLPDVVDGAAPVQGLLQQQQRLLENAKPWLARAEMMWAETERLANGHHRADDLNNLAEELRQVHGKLSEALSTKQTKLETSLAMWTKLDKVLEWYEDGMFLLASQPAPKFQRRGAVDTALTAVEGHLDEAAQLPHSDACFYEQYQMILTAENESVQQVFEKMKRLQLMLEERRLDLGRIAAPVARPVQTVAPQTSMATPPLSPSITASTSITETSTPKKKRDKNGRQAPTIEVMHTKSQGGAQLTSVCGREGEQEDSKLKRRRIVAELVDTERLYVQELHSVLQGYVERMELQDELAAMVPTALREQKHGLFGNLADIHHFHSQVFLHELEACLPAEEGVGQCYLNRREDFKIYEHYCQNKPRSDALWQQYGDCAFFQECKRQLGHRLGLDSYLLKPVQRITRYQLLLKELLKSWPEGDVGTIGPAELSKALTGLQELLQLLNDSLLQQPILGYPGLIWELGTPLQHGDFLVWVERGRERGRVNRFKPQQRHLFLFQHALLFCKRGEGPTDTACFRYKHDLQVSLLGLTENIKGDCKKFEVWCERREQVYIVQAQSVEEKMAWVSELRCLLTQQLQACIKAKQAGSVPSSPFTDFGCTNEKETPTRKKSLKGLPTGEAGRWSSGDETGEEASEAWGLPWCRRSERRASGIRRRLSNRRSSVSSMGETETATAGLAGDREAIGNNGNRTTGSRQTEENGLNMSGRRAILVPCGPTEA
uniref:guanine nucleotide exchange factor DBS-like isoform X3 n=1 Tax=Myxine glutinosa TaxID=7769 RepID=UPI00358E1BC3